MSGRQPINGNNTLNRTPRAIGGGGGGDNWGTQVVESDSTLNGNGLSTDLLGVNYNVNKAIYVDANFGDNLIAEKYQPLKAYADINTAFNNAVNGDVIYVRSGDYTYSTMFSNLTTLNDITFIFEDCVFTPTNLVQYFLDFRSGVPNAMSIKMYGNATFLHDTIRPFMSCRGGGCELDINVTRIEYSRTGFNFDVLNGANPSNCNVVCSEGIFSNDTFTYYAQDRTFNLRGDISVTNNNLNVKFGQAQVYTLVGFGGNIEWNIQSEGKVTLNQNGYLSIISQFTSYHKHYGDVYQFNTYSGDPYGLNTFSGIVSSGGGNAWLYGSVYSYENQPCFRPIFASGKTYIYNGELYCNSSVPIFNRVTANGGANAFFYNCRISDGNNPDNVIRTEDDPTSAFDSNSLYFFNCVISKNPNFIGTNGVIYKNLPDSSGSQSSSRNIFIGCTIIGRDSQTITETDALANGNFYFDSCGSNKNLGLNTVNVGGSLQQGNTYLETENI
jgi:hypothetical protein